MASLPVMSRAPAHPISGRYLLQEELGRGGMGAAYRALDQATGRTVALKLLDSKSPKLSALFEREFHTLASLEHPSVIEVYDFGISEDGRRWYTMELLEGADLSALAPLPWRRACEQLRDVATSLALLHARRLVHRDVSPRNVRVDASGHAKLLDFGTVTPFGRASDIAGTPACIAPEVVRGLELDARTDLFSLGVVAYWALTGRRPYTLARLADAEAAWKVKPRPPCELVPDTPRALEQLVLSLLSVDPLARPASAAEVIDRLVAIADLDDAPLEGLVESHLSSCALIGREREHAQFAQHLERALRGQGAVVLLEGAAGMGKSRLVAEVSIQASLLGMVMLRVDMLASSEPGGLVGALARALLQAAPSEATETLPAHAALFDGVASLHRIASAPDGATDAPPAPPLAAILPGPVGANTNRDPLEQRMLLQSELVDWLCDVAARRPLLVAVDDAHAADPASASALMAIAHACTRARIVLVATLLRGASAPAGVQALARLGSRVRLRNLDPAALAELVRSVFGDVPHLARLSRWIFTASSGIPGVAFELLSELIERGIIRYAGGAWVLPAQLSEADLPSTLDEALASRLAHLGPIALSLARLLALHEGPAALTLCQRVLPEVSSAELFGALDQLIANQILVGSRDSYRIRQEALRRLLVSSLDDAQVRALHLALGQALLAGLPEAGVQDARRAASTKDLALALQAGWHLLRANQAVRAREILRDAGIELAHRGDGFADAVPALEAAHAEYERAGRSPYERAYLMTPLALAGVYLDYRLAYRYGEPLLHVLGELIGLPVAQRLRRWLGRPLALALSLASGFIMSHLPPRRIAAHGFRELMLGLISVASGYLGNCAALADGDRARAIMTLLEPLGWFPRRHVVHLIHEFHRALTDCASGHYAAARTRTLTVLARLRTPVAGLPEDARLQLESGAQLALGSLEVFRTDEAIQGTFAALDRFASSASRVSAAGIRANYYAGRGERAHYEHYLEEVDALAAQIGSTWRQDVLMPRAAWYASAQCEDVLGLKRAARKLEQLAEEHPTLRSTRDAAHANYLTERGRPVEALARYGAVLEEATRAPSLYAMRFVSTYARVLRAAGEPERARALCERTLATLSADDLEFTGLVHGAQLEHALAQADLGAHAEAAARLDALIAMQAQHDNPLIHGLSHRARAQVALLAKDAAAFQLHLTAMQAWFRRTDNPALIAQLQRFADEGRRADLLDAGSLIGALPGARTSPDLEHVGAAFLAKRGPAERLQLAIDLVLEKSGAAQGYLYLLEPAGLRFVAPTVGTEPPAELAQELVTRIASYGDRSGDAQAEVYTVADALQTVVETDEERDQRRTHAAAPYSYLVLSIPRANGQVIVGALALAPGLTPLEPVERSFLEEVARGIYDAGDVHTMYFQGKDTGAG